MDFAIRIFGEINIGGITIYITETMTTTWLIMALLIGFAIVVRIKSNKWNALGKPTGLQNFLELCIGGFENLFKSNAGEKVGYLSSWFFSLFVFMMLANMVGVVGLRPPTADWGLTFPLAVSSFMLFQFAGFRYRPKEYAKSFFAPSPIFFPLNLMGELARPIALSFRLFGNIVGGVVLMSLLYGLAPIVLSILLGGFLHIYFDIAVGILQAFIFIVLSLTFIGIAAGD